MSKKFVYKSVFAPFIDDFVAMKEASGCNYLQAKWIFLEFDNYFCQKKVNQTLITRELIIQWQQTRVNDSPRTLYAKLSVISQLARYMSRHGYDCYIPQLDRHPAGKVNFTPYIFTFEQIRMLFDKSDQLRMSSVRMNSTIFCIPVVLRLLYSTGLRISEALSVRNKDVVFERQYIHIRKTKNNAERIVPVGDELEKVLKQFVSYRDRMPVASINAPDSFFFVKPNGTHCKTASVYKWFRDLLALCDIPFIGKHQGPRVHDLRHTFAVHSLVQMVGNGQDIYNGLPIISTCLGHKSLSATQQYVRLVEAMYPQLVGQCSSVSAYVFPKVTY